MGVDFNIGQHPFFIKGNSMASSNKVVNSSASLQTYMKNIKHFSLSSEETEKKNLEWSTEYSKSFTEFEQNCKIFTSNILNVNPEFDKLKAKSIGEAQAIQKRDLKLRSKLVNLNLRLVVKIAYQYPNAKNNIMDLISEGNIGLMKGIDRFDVSRGVPLIGFVCDWIKAYMIRFIMNNARLMKIATTEDQKKLYFNLNKCRAKLEASGITATDELLAEQLQVNIEDVREMSMRLAAPEASLQVGVEADDENSGPRMDSIKSDEFLADSQIEFDQEKSFRSELFSKFRASLPKILSNKTKKNLYVEVFERRFLQFEEESESTLQEIGDENGISRERVRQIDLKVWNMMHDFMKDETCWNEIRGTL